MAALQDLRELAQRSQFLAVVSTRRSDGTIQSSVVNAGVVPHPIGGAETVGFVTYGPAKLRNLRRRPEVTLTFRAGWEWMAVEGLATLLGPDDVHRDIDADQLRLLLRRIFTAAGGSHDDWENYDRTMAEQRRTAVLVSPTRIYGN